MPNHDARNVAAPAAVADGLVRAAVTMAIEDRVSHLASARELNRFRLGEDQTDIRGWPVVTGDGRIVGAVDRLLVENNSCKVRYASVALVHHAADDNRPNAGGSVLVPVGVVRRVDHRRAIVLDTLTSRQLVAAPRLHARPITRTDEDATLAAYGLPTSRDVPGNLYGTEAFDEHGLEVSIAS